MLGVPSCTIGLCGRLGLRPARAPRVRAGAARPLRSVAGYLPTHDGHLPPGKPPPPLRGQGNAPQTHPDSPSSCAPAVAPGPVGAAAIDSQVHSSRSPNALSPLGIGNLEISANAGVIQSTGRTPAAFAASGRRRLSAVISRSRSCISHNRSTTSPIRSKKTFLNSVPQRQAPRLQRVRFGRHAERASASAISR